MFSEGPGRRKHGSPPPWSRDAEEKLDAKERLRRRHHGKSRAERIEAGPGDLHELTGDPHVLPEDLRDPDAMDPLFVEEMEKRATAHVEDIDRQMREAGVGVAPWNTDKATEEEYYGPVRGLPDTVKRDEIDRQVRPYEHMNRSDIERLNAQLKWTSDMHDDFIEQFPQLGGDVEAVKAAGARVIAQWAREGTRDLMRRIEKDRDGFLFRVADELVLTPSGHERDHGGGGRTQGLDSFGGGTREANVEQPSDLTKELNEDKARSGYW